jgi:hypothetical protein
MYSTPLAPRLGLALLGVGLLVAKPWYRGPLGDVVQSYGGNLTASFAVYFIVSIAASRHGFSRLAAASAALLAVEAFELTDGFGVMSNVFDPYDLLANLVGVAAAFAVDLAAARLARETSS